MSILSAVEDKIRRRLGDEFATRQAETDSIRKTGEELSAGRSKLSTMVARLQQESTELDNNIKILTDKQEEMSELSEKLEESTEMDVDEAVLPTAPLYKQLINAFAEEAAIEDTIYYLGKALGRGSIDIDSFLKQVRSLSRKQFILRATMQKCRKTAGLKV
jgi:ESCRT-I complex subunit TSG101